MPNILVLTALAVTLVCGLLFCLRGRRSIRFIIKIYAFWIGASSVYEWLSPYAPYGALWPWLAAAAAGIVLVVLTFIFEKLAFFLTGGLFGIALFRLVVTFNPVFFGSLAPGMDILIGIIFFLLFGFLAVSAKDFVIILATSVWGAYTTVTSTGILIGLLTSPPAGVLPAFTSLEAYARYSFFAALPAAVPVACVLVLAVVGIICQYRRR